MKPTILCLLSGGVDSTGALHQLITNDQYQGFDLIVHHINIVNRERRALAESQAVKNILNYYVDHLQAQFIYTESTSDTTGFAPLQSKRFPFDMDICTFMAANLVAAYPAISKIVRGRTKTDLEGADTSYVKRTARTKSILESVIMFDAIETPEYLFPVIDFTKEEIWNFLPEPVKQHTWWCRHPQYDENKNAKPCGVCPTCKQMAQITTIK
ncbi:MAG: 7-cyano-7-deazaguanine synthase [Reichenbachiella sp.]|uniref:7-cyano-7-deazaguanine synthase n=1 Tax=Reichenbachiella sp. TaxID=2184521 RepID=UPI0032664C12